MAVAGQAPGALDALASVYLRIGGPGAAGEADGIYRDAIEQNYPGAEVEYGAFLVETGRVAEAVQYLDRDQNATNFEVALLLQSSVYFRGLTGAVDKAAGRKLAIESIAGCAVKPLSTCHSRFGAYRERGVGFHRARDRASDRPRRAWATRRRRAFSPAPI